jgi:hydroxylysine kinase
MQARSHEVLRQDDAFSAAPSPISVAEAEKFALDHFGVGRRARPLSSERDTTFHVTDSDNTQYVLKFIHPGENPRISALQTSALLHLAAAAPDLPVPRLLAARTGRWEAVFEREGEPARLTRMMTYLPGTLLSEAPSQLPARRALGRALAQLNLALRDCSHPPAGQRLLWDLQHAGSLRELLPHIEGADCRALSRAALDRFERRAAPVLAELTAQLIHSDLNPHNVLVDPATPERVVGIIDFGDLVHAPSICDVAIAASYQIDAVDPCSGVEALVEGYRSVAPLKAIELDILFDLIAARMAMTVLISSWRAALFPANRTYILRNQPAARRGLEALASLSAESAIDRFRAMASDTRSWQ